MPSERRSETDSALTKLVIRIVRELCELSIRVYLNELRRLTREPYRAFHSRRRECVSEDGGEEQPDGEDDDGNDIRGIFTTRANLSRQGRIGLDEVDHL